MTEKLDKEVDRFFTEAVLPLRTRLKSGGEALLGTELNKSAASYFVQRKSTQMTRADFESGGFASPASAEADLVRACQHSDAELLVELASGIATLARSLREVQRESSEVSEFIYAMY